MGYDTYKPEWTPENADEKTYAGFVMTGVSDIKKPTPKRPVQKPKKLTIDDYVEGILSCNRPVLAKAITLVESNAAKHFDMAQEIIQRILPYTGKSIRVGITGVPGAGKSTFIEA